MKVNRGMERGYFVGQINEDALNNLKNGLCKVLNYHGYSFHYAVLREAEELYEKGRTNWVFGVSEYPVCVNGFDTRIDFVLRNRNKTRYLIAECKRANPASSNWCFVRAPYSRRNISDFRSVLVEGLKFTEDGLVLFNGETLDNSERLYHLGFELRTGQKGETGVSSRGAIEEAAIQVCKGFNGFIEELKKKGKNFLNESANPIVIIPVIFTTARLFVSEVDLGSADIETGNLELTDVDLSERSWIWYEYNLSPSILKNVMVVTILEM